MHGTGLIYTEFAVNEDVLPGFRAWHSNEHIAERLVIDGMTGAARNVSVADPRAFACRYRATTADVFASAPYQAIAGNASELTRRILAGMNGTRFVGDIVHEEGRGWGGLLWRLRFTLDPSTDDTFGAWFEDVAPTIREDKAVVRMLLARPRRDAANLTDANWILLLEGPDEASLRKIGEKVERAAPPEAEDVATALYRLEHLVI